MKNPRQIALEAINGTVGNAKLDAAFGELFSAHAMFNLWSYQALKGALEVEDSRIDSTGRRYEQLATELEAAWSTFLRSSNQPEATRTVIEVALRIARELKEMIQPIDFYDDTQLLPSMEETSAAGGAAERPR